MGEKLTESITVKLSPTEMHQLKCLAAEEGLSWAEYMRGLLAGDVRRAQQRAYPRSHGATFLLSTL